MLSKFHRLADLALVEQALLLQLTALSLILKAVLPIITLPRLTSFLSRMASSTLGRIPFFHTHRSADRLFTLVDLATTVTHGDARCLPRSLLFFWLLRARRQSVSVCLGVSTRRPLLKGHAWVEQDGAVLGDTPSFIQRYTLFLQLPT